MAHSGGDMKIIAIIFAIALVGIIAYSHVAHGIMVVGLEWLCMILFAMFLKCMGVE